VRLEVRAAGKHRPFFVEFEFTSRLPPVSVFVKNYFRIISNRESPLVTSCSSRSEACVKSAIVTPSNPDVGKSFRFRLPLHVAIQTRLSHHPFGRLFAQSLLLPGFRLLAVCCLPRESSSLIRRDLTTTIHRSGDVYYIVNRRSGP
jgi:hypothetical protein